MGSDCVSVMTDKLPAPAFSLEQSMCNVYMDTIRTNLSVLMRAIVRHVRTKFCVLRNLDLKCRFQFNLLFENLMVVILHGYNTTNSNIHFSLPFLQIDIALVIPYKLLSNVIYELFYVKLNF